MPAPILQSSAAPIQSMEELDSYIRAQVAAEDWCHAALLTDRNNLLIVLRGEDNSIIQVLRFTLPNKTQIVDALKRLNKGVNKLTCCYADNDIGNINSAESVASALATATTSHKTLAQAYEYFDHKPKGKGRGPAIKADVARDVVFDSHGYCMFEGCGENLGVDSLTAVKGNFRYLAHIVASSPNGPRGNEQSTELSNSPSNIMVLCDKHHRLIDKIAVAEYDKHLLTRMKTDFGMRCQSLLEPLAYHPVSTYLALWPIGNNAVDGPSPHEYAVSLKPAQCRPSGAPLTLINHVPGLAQDDSWWSNVAPHDLTHIRAKFSGHSERDRLRAGLYAIGPSAMLIGLGAVLGNKNNLNVVPRYRGSGWGWLRSEPLEKAFSIKGADQLPPQIQEVVVSLFLTDIPRETLAVQTHLENQGIPSIQIVSKQRGNACLGHPQEGAQLRELVLNLLHHLRNKFNVNRIHVLHCAPNAACVEFGRAIEHYHPAVRLYDHHHDGKLKYMVPRLDLEPSGNEVQINPTPSKTVQQFHTYFQTTSVEE